MTQWRRRLRKQPGTQLYRRNGVITPLTPWTVYSFKRIRQTTFTVNYDGLAQFTADGYVFKLSDVQSSTEFTSLYDQYKITGIKAKFFPRVNVLQTVNQGSTFTTIPPIGTIVDYDDAAPPANYAEATQFMGARIHEAFKPFSLYFKPKISTAAYSGAFTSYTAGGSPWLDCNSPNIEYYGMKVFTLPYSAGNNAVTSQDPTWDIVLTYYLKFRGVR